MCIDYRILNAMILKNDYSLLKIQDCIDMIETARNLSSEAKWDNELKKYENQLQIDEDDRVYHRDDSNDNWVLYIEL